MKQLGIFRGRDENSSKCEELIRIQGSAFDEKQKILQALEENGENPGKDVWVFLCSERQQIGSPILS